MTKQEFNEMYEQVKGMDYDDVICIIDTEAPELLDAILALLHLKNKGVDMDDWEKWLTPKLFPNKENERQDSKEQ